MNEENNIERDSFVFYRSFYEAISDIDDPIEKAQIYDAICELALNNNSVELSGTAKVFLALIRPQIQANNKKWKNGKRGGAPKGNTNAKKVDENNQKSTKNQPKTT